MTLKLKKGLNLALEGAVGPDSTVKNVEPVTCAVVPDDFPGFTPKLDVKEGDTVEVGSPLMHDKTCVDLRLVSPVSGKVKAVVRGERRKILRVVVENDRKATAARFDTSLPVATLMAQSGLLAMIRRRPFDVVADPTRTPRDIFVTAMDTAPLAVSPASTLGKDAPEALAAAVKALATLTAGKVYISHGADWQFGNVPGAEMVGVEGPHPAGNVGIQIANIAPINKGETVWALDIVTLYKIGRLLLTGEIDPRVTVAVTGPEVSDPALVTTVAGADIKALTAGRLKDDGRHQRIISGNVLTGTAVSEADGYLRWPYRQVTVIAEGDDVDEFMGWASVAPSKMSVHSALPLHGLRRLFSPDARLNGGRRAMIMSGEYDKVLPMDVMAEYLLKAIMSHNIDDMEALGIYEVTPEDLALCEFVDTSKLPVQQIVRDGLDYLRKETE